MSIDRYVMTLRARLSVASPRADEVTEEVRGHLEDAARELQMAGLPRSASEREAIRRFGEPDEIAMAISGMFRRDRRREARLALTALAAAVLIGLGGSAVVSANTHAPGTYHPTTHGVNRPPAPSDSGSGQRP